MKFITMVPYLFSYLTVLTIVSCVTLRGYDLVFEPSDSMAPRALLDQMEDESPKNLATTSMTVCLYSYLEEYYKLPAVNLLSFSSPQHEKLNEIVLTTEYCTNQTKLSIHGLDAVFPVVPPLNEWSHICSSWDSESGNTYLYINGKKVAESSQTAQGYILGGDGYLVLGQHQGKYNGGFDSEYGVHGKLSQFNLWNRVLKESEGKMKRTLAVKLAQNCKLEGNVVSWISSSWKLFDEIKTQPSDNPCEKGELVKCQCNNNSTLETFKSLLLNYTIEIETQTKELKEYVIFNKQQNDKDTRELTHYCSKLDKDIEELKQRTACRESIEQNINSLKHKIEVHGSKIVVLKGINEANTNTLSTLVNKTEEYHHETEVLTRKSGLYDKSIIDLNQKHSLLLTHTTEVQTQIGQMKQEKDKDMSDLKQHFTTWIKDVEELKHSTGLREKELITMKQKIEVYDNKLIALQRTDKSNQQDIISLKQKIEVSGNEFGILKGENVANSKTLSKLVKSTEEYYQATDALKRKSESHDQSIIDLKQKREVIDKEIKSLKDRNVAYDKESSVQKTKNEGFDRELIMQKNKNVAQDKSITDLTREVNNLKKSSKGWEDGIKSLQKRIEDVAVLVTHLEKKLMAWMQEELSVCRRDH